MAQEKRKNPISDSLITAEVFIRLPGEEVWEDKTLEIRVDHMEMKLSSFIHTSQ